MNKLLVRPDKAHADGCILSVTPESAGWTYVGFAVYRLDCGDVVRFDASDRETCLVVLTGTATIATQSAEFRNVGHRQSVFDGPPASVYVPWQSTVAVIADAPTELAVCTAPGGGQYDARLIEAGTIPREVRGSGTNTRYIQNVLPESAPANSLLVVEVITPGGHWSSYPPHKHDSDALPMESALEETYYHRIRPSQGFAFQRVYTDDRSLDEALVVHDGDCVLVPKGYHPVGAPHGYDVYYLNVMAGPIRKWLFANDPQHEWIIDR